MNVRFIATQVILEVMAHGRSLPDAITLILSRKIPSEKKLSQLDRSFLQALCYGVIRWYFQLEKIAEEFLNKPLKQKDDDVYVLILIGLYQLRYMRIPDYAAVGETVAAVKEIKKIWAKNLVNGVLRQYQRTADKITSVIENNDIAYYSHPEWMVKKIKENWPEDWTAILEANNQHPPFALRINQQATSREEYSKLVVDSSVIAETNYGIILENPKEVGDLPGFSEGAISVQDGAAQLAAELLLLEPEQRVLDACAAPGGKTSHILEIQPNITELIAIDCQVSRMDAVKDNLQRLKLSARCIVADVGLLSTWWDGQLFDRILLDAPCSASGVIRRHPDIKVLRRETDLLSLAEEQKRLLAAAWQTLKPDGVLLYATCSVFPEENELIIEDFLKTHPDAKEEKISATWGRECRIGRQILPGMHRMDGFYYARLRKC